MTEYSKRHELPESEEDLKSIFEAIVKPVQVASVDRLVQGIMSSAEWEELQLNDGGAPSDDLIFDTLYRLNNDLDLNGIGDEPMIFSGKLRPVLDADLTSDGVTVLDIELPPEILQFGELKRDDEGTYLEVWQQEVTCGTFDVKAKKAVHFDDADRRYQGILLNLGLKVTPSSRELPFYAFLDDVQSVATKELNYLGMYEKIDNDYPEIAKQLSWLSPDCRNDQKIIRELSTFYIEIDWALLPKHEPEERQALLEYIESYATSRVNLDTAPYEMWVNDYLYGVNQDNQQVISELAHEQRLTLTVSQLRLEELESEGTIQRFSVMIEALAPARGRGSGNHILYIPAANISGIRNKRNNSYRPKALQPPTEDVSEAAFEPVEGEPTNTAEAVEDVAELPISNELELARMDTLLKDLLKQTSLYTMRHYETRDEARAANIEISKILVAFRDAYPQRSVAIEAEGPGVIAVNAIWDSGKDMVFDPEKNTATITLHNANTQVNDTLAIQNGVFLGEFKGIIHEDEGDGHFEVRPFMICRTVKIKPNDSFILGAREEGLPLLSFQPIQQFAVELNANKVAIGIPEYQRIQRARAKIEQLKHTQPALTDVSNQLQTVLQRFIDVDLVEPEMFEPVDLLTDIGMAVANNEQQTDAVVSVLEDIFVGKLIEVTGAMYDSSGTIHVSGTVNGKPGYVVSTMPQLKVYEPMLVFEGDEDEDNPGQIQYAYVPLSTIQRMVY